MKEPNKRFRLVPDGTRVPFFRYRWIALAWSMIVLLGTIILVATVGLNFGVDFKGGMLIEVRTPAAADLSAMRTTLGELGLGEVSLQNAGGDNDVMIRVAQPEGGADAAKAALEKIRTSLDTLAGPGIDYRRSEFVGPKVSEELLLGGIWAVGISLLGVMAYLWFRFEWQYGLGAIAALVHDVSAAIGLYALFQLEFNLTSLAAVLTIVGFSLNDTVVIYDRVRENLRRFKAMPVDELLDLSINETMARTVTTALTTLLALVALFLVGGEVISGFTIIMIWGVVVGTYSTIYIATPVLYYLNLRRPNEPQAAAPVVAR